MRFVFDAFWILGSIWKMSRHKVLQIPELGVERRFSLTGKRRVPNFGSWAEGLDTFWMARACLGEATSFSLQNALIVAA